jgi:hypothetical protein
MLGNTDIFRYRCTVQFNKIIILFIGTFSSIKILILNLAGAKKPFDGLTDRKNAEAWKNFVQSGGLAKEISKLFRLYYVSYAN